METGRAVKSLLAEKLPLAGLVVNRILPAEADGSFLAQRRQLEQSHLAQIETEFNKLNRYRVPLQPTDIQGLAALEKMAGLLQQAGL